MRGLARALLTAPLAAVLLAGCAQPLPVSLPVSLPGSLTGTLSSSPDAGAGATRTASPAGPARAAAADRATGSTTGSLIASPRRDALPVADAPGGRPLRTLGARTPEGSPTALLVAEDRGEWLQVLLPGRPNGRRGWVRAADVDLAATDWRLEVSLSAKRLRVLRGLLLVAEHPVGVGKAVTPTPSGTYYLTDLLRPPDPDGSYGPYAFGLSAYSEVLTSFAGGPGQIGLHGTDDPASVGRDVSSGCLRLANDVVTSLAAQLPLGTPVEISA